MALLDRVKCALAAATNAGATSFGVGAAISGWQTPAAAGATNGTTYPIVVEEGSAWALFIGTYVAATTSFTLSQFVASSNGANAPAFSTSAVLYCGPFGRDLPWGKAAGADVRTATDDAKFLTSKTLADAIAPVTLTDAGTITPDFGAGVNFAVTLGGNRTLGTPNNLRAGLSGVMLVTQDGTGNRTLGYSSAWKFPGGAPNLSTAAGAVDMIAWYVDASLTVRASLLKGFA